MKQKRSAFWLIHEMFHSLVVGTFSVCLTLAFFLVLPLLQTLTRPPEADLTLQSVDTAQLEPPPPPPEPEEEEEQEEQEEEPPELPDEAPPLDISQLELLLNPGFSDGLLGGDFAVKLNTFGSDNEDMDKLFSISELDQKPRIVYQPAPLLDNIIRKKAPGTVYIVFIVNQRGRVESPVVQKSTDPIFEKAALKAVEKWKFEPGKRNGEPVRFRMRVPITFPKG